MPQASQTAIFTFITGHMGPLVLTIVVLVPYIYISGISQHYVSDDLVHVSTRTSADTKQTFTYIY